MKAAHYLFHTLAACAFLALVACTTTVQTNPTRSATEELLISTAADRTVAQLAPQIPKSSKVFVDVSNFDAVNAADSKYAIAAIREALLKQGAELVGDKKDAQTIVELRSGALSTDQKQFLIGIPAFNIPVPFASSTLPFPEIALYQSKDQKGVAKFGMTSYDAKTGALIAAQGPQYGFAHSIQKTFLVFISWRDNDIIPDEVEKRDADRVGFFSIDKSDLSPGTAAQPSPAISQPQAQSQPAAISQPAVQPGNSQPMIGQAVIPRFQPQR